MDSVIPLNTKNILHLNASARQEDSVSHTLAEEIVNGIRNKNDQVSVVRRDLNTGIPHIDEAWVKANTTPPNERTSSQQNELKLSNQLLDELLQADTLLINIPLYNFGIPSTLKAWLDHVCRAGITFRYTENGPVGLLSGKRAIFVYATGGTQIGSDIDFASVYMRHVMAFIGIQEVHQVAADRLGAGVEVAMATARTSIDETVKHVA